MNIIDFEDMIEISDRVQLTHDLNCEIAKLEQNGYWLFASKEDRQAVGGILPPDRFPVLSVSILRETNESIQKATIDSKQGGV